MDAAIYEATDNPMNDRLRESAVSEFLRTALADAALSVPKLEAKARAAGLLGERQRVTDAKLFKRAKKSLGIRSTRAGFGNAGEWLWELPSNRDEAAVSPSISPLPARSGHRVPVDWVKGVGQLDYQSPLADVPRHRWRQFVDDCTNFVSSSWAERAAALGWDAVALFGCRRNHPLSYLNSAGLLWALNGGRLIELHRDWAVIDLPVNRSQRIFSRRSVEAGIILPWTEGRGHLRDP
jgi:hypothetical protein